MMSVVSCMDYSLRTVSRPTLNLLANESDDDVSPPSGGAMLPSRRSSLESAEERELKALQSRPSTAYSGVRNHVSVDITSLSPFLTSDGEEEGVHDTRRRTPGEKGSRQPIELALKQMLLSPRRMSITRFACYDL